MDGFCAEICGDGGSIVGRNTFQQSKGQALSKIIDIFLGES
jgi:hypothetical protein